MVESIQVTKITCQKPALVELQQAGGALREALKYMTKVQTMGLKTVDVAAR